MVHQASRSPGSLNTALQPLYVWPRGEGAQIVLDEWRLAHRASTENLDKALAELDRLEWHDVEPQGRRRVHARVVGVGGVRPCINRSRM